MQKKFSQPCYLSLLSPLHSTTFMSRSLLTHSVHMIRLSIYHRLYVIVKVATLYLSTLFTFPLLIYPVTTYGPSSIARPQDPKISIPLFLLLSLQFRGVRVPSR